MIIASPPAAEEQALQAPTPPIGFVAAPAEETFQAFYPDRAWDTKQGGKVSLRCSVQTTGELTNCIVVSETPAGFGFGAQSLKLAPQFRLGPGPFLPDSETTIPLTWAATGSSPTKLPPVPLIGRPNWLKKPTAKDFEKFYPDKAARSEVTGQTKIRCKIKADGFMSDCQIEFENPVGWGFGAAALNVSQFYQLAPMSGGKSLEGITFVIPTIWVLN